MENIETKEKDQSTENEDIHGFSGVEIKDAEIIETKKADVVQDELFAKIDVNTLTQGKELAPILHKILTLCHLSKTVDTKILAWVKLIETTTEQEYKELTKIQNNFDFQIANRDFRNDEKLKQEYGRQESMKMTQKLTSLVDVPMIDETLIKSQINLSDAEFQQLAPFYFPVKNIDIVAVVKE